MVRVSALLACCFLAVQSSLAADALPAPIDYSRDIKPILSNHCYACHGPDEGKRQASLRLDQREQAVQELESGSRAIVPGNAGQSELITRVSTQDADLRMPPAETGKSLTAREVELLKRWISEGASWGQHWSFVPPQRPPQPAVKNESWPRTAVDDFILSRLEHAGLSPSPEADRPTLLRRLTLDLTGLPPTPAEIDMFVADTAPGAYERAVDRLLSSPHYGERMAVDWLDSARFADTNGYHIDNGRDMSRWRGWVIDAFNRNMPFDRFTIEQLAGDLLPGATLEQRIASGFNRNHMINFEGGAIPEEYLVAYIVDRVNTTSTVWLGLTVGCAQCHDHKFDPITQKEFYQLYAFFHNVPEVGLDGRAGNATPILKLATPEQQKQLDDLAGQIKPLAKRVTDADPQLDAAQAEWERFASGEEKVQWSVLRPADVRSKAGTSAGAIDHEFIQASHTPDALAIAAIGELKQITAVRVELLFDDAPAGSSEAASTGGSLQVQDVRLTAGALLDPESIKPRDIRWASTSDSLKNGEVAGAVDRDDKTAWKVAVAPGKMQSAVFELDQPLNAGGVSLVNLSLSLSAAEGTSSPRIRLSVTDSKYPHAASNVPADLAKILTTKSANRKPDQQARVREYFRGLLDPEITGLAEQLKKLQAQYNDLDKQIPSTMVMQELPKPRDTFMLIRGQYDKPGEKVSAAVPAIFPPLSSGLPANRLGLAQWLVDPSNPLTARVIVNRYWQMHFGTGLVKTPEDFGSQGEWPMHPELLDWLAVEFIESGWNVKALERLIVTSAVYRQQAAVTPELLARDPENRLLARFPRVRLQAEFIRDQALAVSGLLNAKIGGPSVSPYQPAGLWDDLAYGQNNYSAQSYQQSTGPDLYRRSMYTFWKRTVPPPTMITFDAPDRETCTVRRSRTNTPLQALVLLNDPTYIEASRKLAERIMTAAGTSSDAGIAFAFRTVLGRAPTADEAAVARKLYEAQLAKFSSNVEAANKLLSVGESSRNEQLNPAELAAWTALASALLNLDETVTKG